MRERGRNHPQAAAVQMRLHNCAVFGGGRAAQAARRDRSEEYRRLEQGCRSAGHPGERGSCGGLRLELRAAKWLFQARGGEGGDPSACHRERRLRSQAARQGQRGTGQMHHLQGITRRCRLYFNVTREYTCRGNQGVTRPRRAGQCRVGRFMAMRARRVSSRGCFRS
jgi:hypothetical protein